MPLLTALAVSIGVLGGVATYLFLGPLGGMGLQIWAAFIAWACFYHNGGKEGGLMTTIVCNIFGVVVAWAAFILFNAIAGGLGAPLAGGIAVAIAAAVMCLAANIPSLSSIPSSVYGFAATAAFTLLAGGGKLGNLMEGSVNNNPLLNIIVSMVIGAVFAYASEKVAGMLVGDSAAAKA